MIPLGVLASASGPPPSSGGLTVAYQGMAQSSADLTEYTFSAQPFGPASATRQVIVIAACRATPVSMSATIGGVAATQDAFARKANANMLGIYRANVTDGTTGDVVITLSGSGSLRLAIAIYAVTGTAVAATAATSIVNPADLGVTAPAAGVAVAGSFNLGDSVAPSWVGLTQNLFTGNVEISNLRLAAASALIPSGALTASATWGTATDTASALVAYTAA